MGPYSADSCGRGYSVNCAYPIRGTGKRDSTREFPLDLYREHFQFAIFGQPQIQLHFSCNFIKLTDQKCKHVSITSRTKSVVEHSVVEQDLCEQDSNQQPLRSFV